MLWDWRQLRFQKNVCYDVLKIRCNKMAILRGT